MHNHYPHDFIETQKQTLSDQKAELEKELSAIASYDEASGTYIAMQPELDGDSSEDSGEQGMESEIAQTHQATVASLEQTLNDVKLALHKIEQGEYGVCEETGDFISEERLSAYPAARTCGD